MEVRSISYFGTLHFSAAVEQILILVLKQQLNIQWTLNEAYGFIYLFSESLKQLIPKWGNKLFKIFQWINGLGFIDLHLLKDLMLTEGQVALSPGWLAADLLSCLQ